MTQIADALAPVHTIAVAGADGALGRRVTRLVAADPTALPRAVSLRQRDDRGDQDLGASLAGSDVVVIVDPDSDGDLGGTDGSPSYLASVRRLLEAATSADISSIVVVSSALTYGAWANNPVPLTEDAPLRPAPSSATATQRAEVERLVSEWRGAGEGRTAAVLRPVVTVDRELVEWFTASPWSPARSGAAEGEPPRQFLDLDDLASAVVLAADQHLDGAYNVAPDGWLSADELRELSGRPRIRQPFDLRRPAESAAPYLEFPWVVANDKLRAAGWEPVHSSAEAFVEVDRRGVLRSMSPRVRQELSLAGVGAVVLGAGVVGVWLLRRRARRSS